MIATIKRGGRIVHALASLDPAHGGPPAVASRLAAAQASAGAATLLAAPHPGARLTEVEASIAQVRGVENVSIKFSGGHLSMPQMLKGADAALLHVHGLWQPCLLLALHWARNSAKPFVITPHGMLSTWSLSQKPWRKRLALAAAWGALLRHATFVHALNPAEAADIRAVVPRARIEIVPNAVDAMEFQPADPGPAQPRRYVLFLARLHRMKAPDLAVEAFAAIADRFDDVDLLLAGPDDGELCRVRERIEALRLGQRVRLVGPVYGAEKIALLRHAVCLIQPSRYEGQSVTLLEALAAGIPLVLTPQCNFPEASLAGAAIVAQPQAGSLGEALATFLSEGDRRRAAVEAGLRLIAEKFQWPEVARQLLRLYESAGTLRPVRAGEAA